MLLADKLDLQNKLKLNMLQVRSSMPSICVSCALFVYTGARARGAD